MIEIVKAKEQHIIDLANLWMEFMRFSQDIDPIHEPQDDAIPIFINEHLRPAMETTNSLVLVALDGERVIGYSYSFVVENSALVKRKSYGCVHDLYITYQYRRKGIGERMFKEITKWFRMNEINQVELDVMTRNKAGASFWEKLGFKDLNRRLYRTL